MSNAHQFIDATVCDRDWQTRALQRLVRGNPDRASLTLDQALGDPIFGRIVRAFAAQLRSEHQAAEERAARAARYGRRMQWNGYGYKPTPEAPR